jgi:hypothetical protein
LIWQKSFFIEEETPKEDPPLDLDQK